MYMLDLDHEPSYNLLKKSFITAKDTEVDRTRRYGRWFNPPDVWLQAFQDRIKKGFMVSIFNIWGCRRKKRFYLRF